LAPVWNVAHPRISLLFFLDHYFTHIALQSAAALINHASRLIICNTLLFLAVPSANLH
jgi:hypothetical protein